MQHSINNEITSENRRLINCEWVEGALFIIICCTPGIVVNVGIDTYAFNAHWPWMIVAISGITIGAVWNYATIRFDT